MSQSNKPAMNNQPEYPKPETIENQYKVPEGMPLDQAACFEQDHKIEYMVFDEATEAQLSYDITFYEALIPEIVEAAKKEWEANHVDTP